MSTTDWKARAEREAAAILAESAPFGDDYQRVLSLVALAWVNGRITGIHAALYGSEAAAESLREAL